MGIERRRGLQTGDKEGEGERGNLVQGGCISNGVDGALAALHSQVVVHVRRLRIRLLQGHDITTPLVGDVCKPLGVGHPITLG